MSLDPANWIPLRPQTVTMNGSPSGCRRVIVYVLVPFSIVGTQT